MTLHAAKGLEFEIVFLPGWEEGLFPNQRSLDDSGLAGLEEERRLAYVGLTRARRQARIYYALNRRVRGLWQTSIPSRFIQELPAGHVEFDEFIGTSDRNYGSWPRAGLETGFASRYDTPGWRRAEARQREWGDSGSRGPGLSPILEGSAHRQASPSSSFHAGLAGVPQQVWPGRRDRRGRVQIDRRFRQGRPKIGDGQFRRRRGIARTEQRQGGGRPTAAPIGRGALFCHRTSTCVRQLCFSD